MSNTTTQIRAAVVREKGGPFSIETLSLEGPRRDEVLVKVVATGMCHTDMVARDKVYPVPHPIVLIHEGSHQWPRCRADRLGQNPLLPLTSEGKRQSQGQTTR
jgi:hypothetical protein